MWNPATHDVSIPLNKLNADSYSLAVSGDIFRWLIDYGSEDLIERVSNIECMKWNEDLTDESSGPRQGSSICSNVA